ncbi:LpqB family beta-propeller domain-containing protein [Arsenicicoccus sp. oral taxon 190]|uniref:LpqB family beta-propeller domain-containing protein n=1 Tax=Arsenicicoccus sp. oral taxon 190 TaxID=1658671 RepID=UPI00067A3249|nr:LpqB family beta-propeller domain-containing protein [Arsenicicoccus sp. oral taxon 190]AKT51431.1 hypothetical protein ADJ73_09075 [Arsenicicoccus sp. oral taxon 190]
MRGAGAAALAGLVAVLLGACHGLPGSTPVEQGQVVGRAQPEGVRIIPRGPVPGSDADALVLDFLRAGVGADDDSGVAREYLTASASAQWHPDGSAWIYENPQALRVAVVRPGTVTVTGTASAELDKEGHYVELPPGQVRTATLTLARVDDQWRIDGGLDRLTAAWISRADFGRYSSFALTYAAPQDDVAVTDRRWFLQGPGLITRLTRAQLSPPPSYLQGAVVTGIPEYTDLSMGAVSVESQVAHVALSGRAINADDRNRRLMWQQLTTTLTALTGVDAVQLEADGSRLTVPGLPDRPLTAADVSLHPPTQPSGPVLLRSRAGLERADPARLADPEVRQERLPQRDVAGPPLPQVGARWFRLAVSPDGHEVAGIDGDRSALARWRDGRLVEVPDVGTDLTRPAYDGSGHLWLSGRTAGGTRVLVQPTADLSGRPPAAINVPWLADRTVVALRPSPDGQRVLVVSQGAKDGRTSVGVAGVLRKDGHPVGLAAPIAVAGGLTEVVDAAWLDTETLGVVGRSDPAADHRVVVAPISGPSQTLGPVPGATGITTYAGTRNIVVTTRRGVALVRAGNQFVPLVATSDFVVPGH